MAIPPLDDSMRSRIERVLKSYRDLPYGWDGEFGEPPAPEAVRDMLRVMDAIPDGWPAPRPQVSGDGEVGLFWDDGESGVFVDGGSYGDSDGVCWYADGWGSDSSSPDGLPAAVKRCLKSVSTDLDVTALVLRLASAQEAIRAAAAGEAVTFRFTLPSDKRRALVPWLVSASARASSGAEAERLRAVACAMAYPEGFPGLADPDLREWVSKNWPRRGDPARGLQGEIA